MFMIHVCMYKKANEIVDSYESLWSMFLNSDILQRSDMTPTHILLTERDITPNLKKFCKSFATGVVCRSWMLTQPTTRPCTISDLRMFDSLCLH